MTTEIGKRMKEFRKLRGLTQQQLAEGICTQAMISNFEKGESIPSSSVLFSLSSRLGVDINSFFFGLKPSTKMSNSPHHFQQLIRKLVADHDYQTIYFLIQKELENIDSLSNEELAFLYWHEGVCEWEIKQDSEAALKYLYKALKIKLDTNSTLPISIHNSRAIIYFNLEKYDDALREYACCLDMIQQIRDVDINIIKKVYFGLSRVYLYHQNFEDALIYCESAIQLTLQNESLYLLGELLFQKGRIFVKSFDFHQGKITLQQAKSIFELEGKIDNIHVINRLLKSCEIRINEELN